jgi:hypothetical protein
MSAFRERTEVYCDPVQRVNVTKPRGLVALDRDCYTVHRNRKPDHAGVTQW